MKVGSGSMVEEPTAGDDLEAKHSSAGHKLGQLVGDWIEEYFVLPLLAKVAERLELYLDHRFKNRPARGEKILWRDEEGNDVAYDFVMELGGGDNKIGLPVGFFESFWRRGKRHSKDKARDDSGKLAPMRETYPTARFLGIIATGDFTRPARTLVQSHNIDLFYIPKAKIVAAFQQVGLQVDYPDTMLELDKAVLADSFERGVTETVKREAATRLIDLVSTAVIEGYADRVRAALRALPQEIRFIARKDSAPRVFETTAEATAFLEHPEFEFSDPTESYVYQVTFSDGTEFQRAVPSLEALRALHSQIVALETHMARIRA